jgi:hypothetical protein
MNKAMGDRQMVMASKAVRPTATQQGRQTNSHHCGQKAHPQARQRGSEHSLRHRLCLPGQKEDHQQAQSHQSQGGDDSFEDVHHGVEKDSGSGFEGQPARGGRKGNNADDAGGSEKAGGDASHYIAFDNRPFRPFNLAAYGHHITADESR